MSLFCYFVFLAVLSHAQLPQQESLTLPKFPRLKSEIVPISPLQIQKTPSNSATLKSIPRRSSPSFTAKSGLSKFDLGKMAKSVVGAIASALGLLPRQPADVEDCCACRFIWLQVEMAVGNARVEEEVYAAFVDYCIKAQKSYIFFKPCRSMFHNITHFVADYIDSYTVNQLCEKNYMCR